MTKPLLIDGHQDLAYNMLTYGRDYTRPVAQTRRLEAATQTPERTGDALLGWPEYMAGNVAVVFGTLFAAPTRRALGDWDILVYNNPSEAHALYRKQIDVYHRLFETHPEKFTHIDTLVSLRHHLARWQAVQSDGEVELPVGLVILMEGAEGIQTSAELADWWEYGVRIIGPAWAGTRYCGGTREPGPLTEEGYALLKGMAEFGFALDLSHMDEQAALQALDFYPRRVIASHANALALLKGSESNRHLPDRVIQGILERDGIIGVLPGNGFLKVGWKDTGGRENVSLAMVAAQIDYICQMAGDAKHTAIGSDFEGGFGLQSVPREIDSIADLQKLAPNLADKGYTAEDIEHIFHGNWQRLLEDILP